MRTANHRKLDFEIVSTLKNFNDFANFDSYRCYPAYSQLNSYYYNHEFRTDGFQFYNNEKEVYFAIRNQNKKLDSWVTVTETFYYDD